MSPMLNTSKFDSTIENERNLGRPLNCVTHKKRIRFALKFKQIKMSKLRVKIIKTRPICLKYEFIIIQSRVQNNGVSN